MKNYTRMSYFVLFFGLTMVGALLYSLVTSWSAILASGLLAIGVFLFYLIFIPIGLIIVLSGLIKLRVASKPEAKLNQLKEKMARLGYGQPYKVIVFDGDREKAKSIRSSLKYRYYGRDYSYTPVDELPDNLQTLKNTLPFFLRFDYVLNPTVDHILVRDSLTGEWMIFER